VSEGHGREVLNLRSLEVESRIALNPPPPLAESKECPQTFELLETGTRAVFPFGAESVEGFEIEFLQISQSSFLAEIIDLLNSSLYL
jgi:hypothetical protein